MWPFKKKYPDIREFGLLTESWSIATAKHDGAPLIVRKNTGCADWVGHPDFSIKLGFAIPWNKQIPGGLPDPSENLELNSIEDQIIKKTTSVTKAICALTLTTGIMKEFVFYISDGSVVESLHAGLKQSIKSHDVQCMAVIEKDWKTYRQF